MGSTLDPQSLMNFLNAQAGNSSGYNQAASIPAPDRVPPTSVPTPAPSAPSVPPAPPAPPTPPNGGPPPGGSAQQPQLGPQLTGIKGYLSNILYQMGEATKAHLGMPTDIQVQQKQQQINIEQQKASADMFAKQSEAEYRKSMTAMNAPQPITDQQEADALGLKIGDMVSPSQKFALYKEKLSMQGKLGVAQIGANARLGAAQIQALSRMSQTTMKAAYMPDGTLGVGLYDKAGNFRGYADNAVVPAAYMEKIHHGQEFKVDSSGHLFEVNTTSTSSPLVPPPSDPNQLIQGPQSPSGQPQNINDPQPLPGAPKSTIIHQLRKGAAAAKQPTSGVNARMVMSNGKPVEMPGATQMMVGTNPQGQQVAGTADELRTAGVANITKLDSGEAAKVNIARQLTSPNGLFALVDKDLAQFKPGELEGLAPRWNEFLAGTVGTADPRYIKLRTHLNGLLSTALMQAHVGARGGERIMEHFEGLANAGKMSLPTVKAALNAERQYVEEKAMRPGAVASETRQYLGATYEKQSDGSWKKRP